MLDAINRENIVEISFLKGLPAIMEWEDNFGELSTLCHAFILHVRYNLPKWVIKIVLDKLFSGRIWIKLIDFIAW